MPDYVTFTTVRATVPDLLVLVATVKTVTGDPTAVLWREALTGVWRGKKATLWTSSDLAAVQTALDTTPALTPQLAAQRLIDIFPIEYKALVLALIDQLNVIRNLLVPVKTPDITPAQAIAAIRTKAGTL
jgi:hypothetical protein